MLPSNNILLGRTERSLLSQSARCCQEGATAIASCLGNRKVIHCCLSQSTIRHKKWNIVRNWDLATTCKRYMDEVNRSLLWLNTNGVWVNIPFTRGTKYFIIIIYDFCFCYVACLLFDFLNSIIAVTSS